MVSLFMSLFLAFVLSALQLPFALSQTPIDFSQYHFGYNNRPIFEAVIRDLVSEFGLPVSTAYRKGLQAKIDQIVIDEAQIDKYLKDTNTPTEREAIVRFILAHEYFHVLLKHTHIRDSLRVPKEIQIKGSFSQARKQMERQVDYLAAKYLYKLGLQTEPIQDMFLKHPELEGGEEYPSAKERAEIVLLAKKQGMDERQFNHEAIHCTFLLSTLSSKFE